MMRDKIENVFTPRSAKVNKMMYINRGDLEKELYRKTRGTQHIIIHGESGCGKSWLYKKVLAEKKIHYEVVNLASADNHKSIDKILELATATGESERNGYTVGLSNICYTVLQKIYESLLWRFPSQRSHRETVVLPIMYVKLALEIIK